MEAHILNGDALTDRMRSAGFQQLIVMRECLVDGPVKATSLEDFWDVRAGYISSTFGGTKEEYYDHVVTELNKLNSINPDSSVYLWFGDDLFCQANMWFIINHLFELGLTKNLYRIFPKILYDRWGDYGRHTPDDFKELYVNRVHFPDNDIQLGRNLWNAYANADLHTLKQLSATPVNCFHDLAEVVQAHIDRFAQPGRPEKVLQEIMASGKKDFKDIFSEFCKREGIYGFGDDQVKRMLVEI
jgi:hypothetical protein